MDTIEERAKRYSDEVKLTILGWEQKLDDTNRIIARESYAKGATDQRAIDIEKVKSMEEKFYNIDVNDDETYFIVKFSGSNGIVYDMSNTKVLSCKKMLEQVKGFCDITTACIKSVGFDERLNMYSYRLLADIQGYKQQHIAWIYSPYSDKPYWTICQK